MLRSGEANAYVNADDSQYAQLEALPGKRTEAVPIDGTGALIFNTMQTLADARVRRAFAQGLDLPSVIDKTLFGGDRTRDPGRGLFEWAYDPVAYAMPAHDVAAAAALLERAAGEWEADGLRHKGGASSSLDIIVRADKPSALEMATLMQAQQRPLGIRLSIRRFAVSALVAPNGPLYGGHYDIALFPFIAGFDPDVRDQFGCKRIPPNGFNKARYCNPALGRVMNEAVRPYDRAARIPYYREVQRILRGRSADGRNVPSCLHQHISVVVYETNTRPSTRRSGTSRTGATRPLSRQS